MVQEAIGIPRFPVELLGGFFGGAKDDGGGCRAVGMVGCPKVVRNVVEGDIVLPPETEGRRCALGDFEDGRRGAHGTFGRDFGIAAGAGVCSCCDERCGVIRRLILHNGGDGYGGFADGAEDFFGNVLVHLAFFGRVLIVTKGREGRV